MLNEDDFSQKYGTLYRCQRTESIHSSVQLWFTPIFLSKRFILALSTVLLSNFSLSQIAFYIGLSLYSMCFVSSVRPFSNPVLNRINFLNECFLLLTSYYLLFLTDIVPDMEMREQIGWNYLYTLITVAGFNFLVVFQQLAAVIIRRIRLHYVRQQNRLKAEARIRERWKY